MISRVMNTFLQLYSPVYLHGIRGRNPQVHRIGEWPG